jgi:hypothetical protein
MFCETLPKINLIVSKTPIEIEFKSSKIKELDIIEKPKFIFFQLKDLNRGKLKYKMDVLCTTGTIKLGDFEIPVPKFRDEKNLKIYVYDNALRIDYV